MHIRYEIISFIHVFASLNIPLCKLDIRQQECN